MPRIRPLKPCLATAALRPRVLRAAERAAGGRVGSVASTGGQSSRMKFSFHSCGVAVAEGVHLRELPLGVDVHHRERHVAEERLAHQPQDDVAVLAERPEDRQLVQLGEGLAQDVDALRFQRVQVVHQSIPRSQATRAGVRVARATIVGPGFGWVKRSDRQRRLATCETAPYSQPRRRTSTRRGWQVSRRCGGRTGTAAVRGGRAITSSGCRRCPRARSRSAGSSRRRRARG